MRARQAAEVARPTPVPPTPATDRAHHSYTFTYAQQDTIPYAPHVSDSGRLLETPARATCLHRQREPALTSRSCHWIGPAARDTCSSHLLGPPMAHGLSWLLLDSPGLLCPSWPRLAGLGCSCPPKPGGTPGALSTIEIHRSDIKKVKFACSPQSKFMDPVVQNLS